MTTITSAVPSVIAALVTLFRNAATIGQATPPVTVYDGNEPTDDSPELILWVGASGSPSASGEATPAASSQQEWAAIGRRARSEQVTVECCAAAWSGDAGIGAVRVSAYAIMAAVETVMQSADPSVLGAGILFPDPGVTGGQLSQSSTNAGPLAQVSFQIVLKARIGG